MKIVYFGSGKFGLPSLKSLKEMGFDLVCVVTQPDRQKGRGLKQAETPIKEFAQNSGIKICQPAKVNTQESLEFLKELNADLFIVISYGQMLSEALLQLPRQFPLNIHASLLPKYRGAAPINWAIINGEKETGVTIMKMSRQMDAGPMLLQKSLAIGSFDNALTLEEKLAELAVSALREALVEVEANKYSLKEQDPSAVSLAPKLEKHDGLIHWDKGAVEIERLIRGLINWPGAFTYYKGKLLKIYQAKVLPQDSLGVSKPGTVLRVHQDGILVGAGEDCLLIEELQIEGKRKMTAKEFIAGHKIAPGECFKKNLAQD